MSVHTGINKINNIVTSSFSIVTVLYTQLQHAESGPVLLAWQGGEA